MNAQMAEIGENISALRKKKGVTQEELGRALGVSMQAVSRWENGGAPDLMLLPALADYFGVSVDELFGRESGAVQAETAILQRLHGLPAEERIEAAFRLCWQVERGLFGADEYLGEDELNRLMARGAECSRFTADEGITEAAVGQKYYFFFISPEPENGRYEKLYQKEKHTKLFALLSAPDAYDALMFIFSREKNPFTARLLEKTLNISVGRAVEILRSFEEFNLVSHSLLELDDEQITIYNIGYQPQVIPFLMLTDVMADPPSSFCYQSSRRKRPYFFKGKKEE